MVNYYTAARKNTHTKIVIIWNVFQIWLVWHRTFFLKVFYSMSSNPVSKRGRVAPDVASRGSLTIPFRKVISRKHLKQSFARRVIFLSYVGNLFTSRRPRCCSFLLKGWGGSWEQLFHIIYTGLLQMASKSSKRVVGTSDWSTVA